MQKPNERHLPLAHFQSLAVVLHEGDKIAPSPVKLAVLGHRRNGRSSNDGARLIVSYRRGGTLCG
jgi:hypothetical protein